LAIVAAAEAVQHVLRAGRTDAEEHYATRATPSLAIRASTFSCAVKYAVHVDQTPARHFAIAAAKAVPARAPFRSY
jgi:hypothetical protein